MLLRTLLAGLTCLAVRPAFAEPPENAGAWALDGSIALVSDYRWRGVSLSGEAASLQTEATVSHQSGLWFWGAANSVDAAYGGTELGAGAGFTKAVAGVDLSASLIQYLYPGEDGLDYAEADIEAGWEVNGFAFAAGVNYIPPQNNYGEDIYAWASAERGLNDHIALHGRIGFDSGSMASGADPTADYEFGLRADCGRASFDVSYVAAADVDHAVVARLSYGL